MNWWADEDKNHFLQNVLLFENLRKNLQIEQQENWKQVRSLVHHRPRSTKEKAH